MPNFKTLNKKVVFLLKRGSVGIIPTDTLYGLVGQALNRKTVEKIYLLRKRNPKKPMIILIGSTSDLKKFNIILKPKTSNLKPGTWPPKTSIIFDCPAAKFRYLHRGAKTLAFRLPKSFRIRALLKKTGPLVAPSANTEGKPPSKNIKEAQKYFKDKVDFYVDAGRITGKSSKLIKIENNKIVQLRK